MSFLQCGACKMRNILCLTLLFMSTAPSASFSISFRANAFGKIGSPASLADFRDATTLSRGSPTSSGGILTFQASAQRRKMSGKSHTHTSTAPLLCRGQTRKMRCSIELGISSRRGASLHCKTATAAESPSGRVVQPFKAFGLLLRKALLNCMIVLSILVFEAIDVLLNVVAIATTMLQSMAAGPIRVFRKTPNSEKPKQRVVIVGGSFAGLAVARGLRKDFDVTIIDPHEYFEYTPGVLRLFVKPSYFNALSAKHRSRRGVRFVQGAVEEVREEHVEVRGTSEGEGAGKGERERVEYDVLVLACGSEYGEQGIKDCEADWSRAARARRWEAMAARVREAQGVLVVGTGPVGVELAAEVMAAFPEKEVTLSGTAEELCDGFAVPATKEEARRWVEERGGRVLLGGRCTEAKGEGGEGRGRVFECGKGGGERVEAEEVLWCFGARPATGFLEGGAVGGAVAGDGAIRVERSLRVVGQERVFALGDAIQVEGAAPHAKLGHTAEVQARVLCNNVRQAVEGGGEVGGLLLYAPTPEHSMYALSLGKYHASIRFGPLVLSGFVAAYLKWAVEWTKVAQGGGRRVGELVWELADFITARTVDKDAYALAPAAEDAPGSGAVDSVTA